MDRAEVIYEYNCKRVRKYMRTIKNDLKMRLGTLRIQ